MKNRQTLYIILGILLLFVIAYVSRTTINNLFVYGWSDWPTHEANSSCSWARRSFSKISVFEQKCSNPTLPSSLSENGDGTILETEKSEYGYSFKLQLFSKNANINPTEVMNEWYAKLTAEQKKTCEVMDADEPLQYF